MKRGKQIHALMEFALKLNNLGRLSFNDMVSENYSSAEPLDDGIVYELYDYVSKNNPKGLVEKELWWEFEGVQIVSVLDFVCGRIEDGSYEIIDWKSSKRRDKPNPINMFQLLMYHLAIQTYYADIIERKPTEYKSRIVTFVSTKQTNTFSDSFNFSQDDFDYAVEDFREKIRYFQVLRDNNIWPKERNNTSCGRCPLKDECIPFYDKIENIG
jgi:CRISPR/Cas system-associated exonuclease Cas4 (RecB family)